jgi:hypothetical protein
MFESALDAVSQLSIDQQEIYEKLTDKMNRYGLTLLINGGINESTTTFG